MARPSRARALTAALIGGVALATALAGAAPPGAAAGSALAVAAGGEGASPALSRHQEELGLLRALVGNGGEPAEGPGTAADQAFASRAYPADTISLAQSQRAQDAFTTVQARGAVASAAARPWQPAGPSRALYPFKQLRNRDNYVPNTYVAGGRTTSLAVAPTCRPGACRMWVTPAGGGVWRTEDALAATPAWRYLSGPFGINAMGTVSLDPNDPTGNTLYVGTGEANVCGSGCVAGVGLYRSTDGGDSWSATLGASALSGKGIGRIAVKPGSPDTLYAATTTALRGMSGACCSGVTRPVPDAAKWGLYKSTDRGRSWTFVHNGSADARSCTGSLSEFANNGDCSPRGVSEVAFDPSDPATLYAASFARGVWRSTDEGRTWSQIKPSLNAALFTSRPALAVTRLSNGKTRMYVYEGNVGNPTARLFRSDSVASGSPTFTDLSSADPASPGYATYDQCGGQCWYDVFVHTPEGHPDVVYTGGSYAYGETGRISNGRAVVLSTDAGVSGTDMTMDDTSRLHPNGLHPDQHALVTRPGRPFEFFEANDGGVMRSSGEFASASDTCGDRGLDGDALRRCRQLLSKVPTRLTGINEGLRTLQFIDLSVSPHDPSVVQGGTQDNGTWETGGSAVTWRNTIIGDGGFSGFDARLPDFRVHDYYDASPDVNFDAGRFDKWIWTGDPVFGIAGTLFYTPLTTDPLVSGTMFIGTGAGVHRTTTYGLGTRSKADALRICNTLTGTFEDTCGDWRLLGVTPLTSTGWGNREGGAVSAIARTTATATTAWAGTGTGRVFVSRNVDAADPAAVRWTRVDLPSTPGRFVSGITVDPRDGNRAWVSYSGYGSNTPGETGHVYSVAFDPGRGTARWTDLSDGLDDLPVTDVARDAGTGTVYASTDFGVMALPQGGTWREAARGLPQVEVAGLTLSPDGRTLWAATHGLAAYKLDLR